MDGNAEVPDDGQGFLLDVLTAPPVMLPKQSLDRLGSRSDSVLWAVSWCRVVGDVSKMRYMA